MGDRVYRVYGLYAGMRYMFGYDFRFLLVFVRLLINRKLFTPAFVCFQNSTKTTLKRPLLPKQM